MQRMPREREVGSLWIGGALSFLEQLCLKSFVDQGQKITLFSYEDIPNLPAGVIRRDGREVLNTDRFLKYEKKDSVALFADLFRLHMIRQNPGMIWVDTDVYCHRVIDYDSDYVMAFEKTEGRRVNNAVLGLPADSAMLADMLAFVADEYAIPPHAKPKVREEYARLRDAGTPVHVTQQQWGIWGPSLVSHMAWKHRVLHRVLRPDAFYPVIWENRTAMIGPAAAVHAAITPESTGIHLWASNKRELALRHHGVPPPGSYLAELMEKHGIVAEDALLRSRAGRVLDGELVERIDLAGVARFADIGGRARGLALECWKRWDCGIDLVDFDRRAGLLPGISDWVGPYRDYLLDQGVPAEKISVPKTGADLRPADVLARLTGPDDAGKMKGLEPVLSRCLQPGSVMFIDIKSGSGGFPYLRRLGESETLSTSGTAEKNWSRVLFRAGPEAGQAAPSNEADWAEIAAGLVGPGGFTRANAMHSFLYIPRGDTLVVTFDNLDIAMTKREDRRPWGFGFIEKQGWSMLGVMANGWTWYRDPWVYAQFDDLAASGFFAGFRRVVFYGASMGGYAAAAFVPACPGADVVAISPQSTLDKAVVPWETRYKTAWGADYSGKYGDAGQVSAAAGRVTILYDPYEPLDAGHVARFTAPNVTLLRTPLLGHRLGSSLHQMGILQQITLGALNGTLTEAEFYRVLRARKSFSRYQRELFKRALDRGHPELARKLARWVLTRGDNRYIRKALAGM
jgi:hypothetical protein